MPAQHDSTQHPRPITVVVVDDEQMIRGALTQTLTGGGLDLVGEAANAQDSLRLVIDVRPDVVLMDLRLPDTSGVRAIERLALLAPASRILIPHPHRAKPRRGGDRRRRQRLHPQDRTAEGDHRRGQSNRCRRIRHLLPDRRKLLQRIRERDIPVTTASDNAASAIRAVLTERELEIFERLASGRSNHDIADELSLSTNTVHNHIASILAKLHLDNRIQAAVQAVRSGIS
jgi:DNA-binding NarL/FixJ family response regulator